MDPITVGLITLLLSIVIVRIWNARQKRLAIAKKIDVLGGEKYYPLIGTTWGLLKAGRKNFFEAYQKRNSDNGPLFRSWLGNTPYIHLMKPEHIEVVLSSSEHLKKGDNYRFVGPWLGEGLITSDGAKWHHHRKLITPTFHFSILDNFMEIFAEKAQTLVDIIQEKANGTFFDVYPHLKHCALDIICETAMGIKVNAMQVQSTYVQTVYDLIELVIQRMFNPFLHNNFIYSLTRTGRETQKCLNILHGFTRNVIKERREKLKARNSNKKGLSEEDKLMGKKERLAFLDLLLESNEGGKHMSDEEMREEVDTFMFAGHDTTTVTLSWTLLALACNKDIQDKVHEELDGIFHGEEREITPEDLNQMKYLERVIKETLRYFTIVPAIVRKLSKDIVLDGHEIPAGVSAVIHILELHKDPVQFKNPEKFDPDRFLKENSIKRHPYAYIPFSAGPRNCLGQKFSSKSTRTLIAAILRRFNVKAKETPETIKCFNEIVMRPQNGMWLSFENRKSYQ